VVAVAAVIWTTKFRSDRMMAGGVWTMAPSFPI
jgi:hypothetical protein